MKSNNVLHLDLAGNEDVKAALGGLSVGDDYCITICGKVSAVDDQTFEGSIDEIEPEGEAGSDVSNDEPVMIMIGAGKAKKKPAPKAKETTEEDAEGETETV